MGNEIGIDAVTSLTNVGGTSPVKHQDVEDDIKVFGTTNPVAAKVFTDADFAEMWLEAGVKSTEAPQASATVTAYTAMDVAGLDLVELDEIFADEPEVVAHTLAAFQNGSALRIERENQAVATLMETLPEGTTEEEFEAFMYAFNVA